jgi:hypothetical protein
VVSNGCTVVSSRNWSHVAPNASHSSRELALDRDRERPSHERVVLGRRAGGDELAKCRGEHREDLADLGRLHPGLEVLEEHVVGVVVRREALDVPAAEIDHPLERGPERGEVRVLACADPHVVRLGRGLRELDRELGRHAPRPVPVVAGHANEAGVVGVVRERRGVRLELLEELAEAVVDEPLMDELLERAELRGS